MKKKYFYLSFLLITLILCADSLINPGMSNMGGAPSGRTGSPGDGGSTCATRGCHSGNAVVSVPDIISSDVPVTGYVPGTVYNITCSCTGGPSNTFGFEICAEDNLHAKKGTLAITGSGTKLISSNKYITQTSSGVTGYGNSKSWTLKWTAPVAGTGQITFYGAFNFANGNGNSSGDQIKTSTLVIQEQITASVNDLSGGSTDLKLYPVPASHFLSASYSLKQESQIEFSLYDISGKKVKTFLSENKSPGLHNETFNISDVDVSVVYFVVMNSGERSNVQKIMIQK